MLPVLSLNLELSPCEDKILKETQNNIKSTFRVPTLCFLFRVCLDKSPKFMQNSKLRFHFYNSFFYVSFILTASFILFFLVTSALHLSFSPE